MRRISKGIDGKVFRTNILFAGIVVYGLIHGAVYLTLVPPWQHYDEPSHFEYTWLVARQNRLPQPFGWDSLMRRQLAASMAENDFYPQAAAPNLLKEFPGIGVSQLEDAPLYYVLAAIPLKLVRYAGVTDQLYAGRLVSLTFYLATVVIAYLVVRDLTGTSNPLRWMIPAVILMTPAFTDLMTALNNDVGATLVFSAFLWVGVRILLRGWTFSRALALVGLTVLCLITKNTVFIAAPLAMLLFILWLIQQRPRLGLAAVLLGLGLLVLAAPRALSLQDAAFWYRKEFAAQELPPTRLQSAAAPFGEQALQIVSGVNGGSQPILFQPFPSATLQDVRGEEISLGAWIWASQELEIAGPKIWTDTKVVSERIAVGVQPAFFAVSTTVPKMANRLQIVLEPQLSAADQSVSVWYDGLVLAVGSRGNGVPQFNDAALGSGTWSGSNFENLVRNPSAERAWLTLQPRLLNGFANRSNLPVHALTSVQDYQTFGDIYLLTAKNLFQSFWARFGWNHIGLPASWYWTILAFTLIGLAGSIWYLRSQWRSFSTARKMAIGWLVLSGISLWVAVIFRPILPFWNSSPFIPSARYAYPAIIPTMFLLVSGWYFFLGRLPARYRGLATAVLFALLLILDIYSLVTVYQAFYSS